MQTTRHSQDKEGTCGLYLIYTTKGFYSRNAFRKSMAAEINQTDINILSSNTVLKIEDAITGELIYCRTINPNDVNRFTINRNHISRIERPPYSLR